MTEELGLVVYLSDEDLDGLLQTVIASRLLAEAHANTPRDPRAVEWLALALRLQRAERALRRGRHNYDVLLAEIEADR